MSVPVWKGHSTLRPASPSIKVETTIVKAAKFFQSANWFSYGGVHIFCPTKTATADMSWGLGEKEKVGLGLVVLCFLFLFFLNNKHHPPLPQKKNKTKKPTKNKPQNPAKNS